MDVDNKVLRIQSPCSIEDTARVCTVSKVHGVYGVGCKFHTVFKTQSGSYCVEDAVLFIQCLGYRVHTVLRIQTVLRM